MALYEQKDMLELEHQICPTMWYPTVVLKPEGLSKFLCHAIGCPRLQTVMPEPSVLCVLVVLGTLL